MEITTSHNISVTDILNIIHSENDMFAIVTFLSSSDDIDLAITLARSVRIFSLAKSILFARRDIQIGDIFDTTIHVDDVNEYHLFGLTEYKKILYIPLSSVIQLPIDSIFVSDIPTRVSYTSNHALLLEPSRFALDLYRQEKSNNLIDFYIQHGYKMKEIKSKSILSVSREMKRDTSSIWSKIYKNTYVYQSYKRDKLYNHLILILEPILGKRIHEVLKKYISLYQQAFVTKKANEASNYELLEAYGDRFLAGQYAWLMVRTPGIINAHQVTKIGSYFQNQYSLNEISKYLNLTPYIITGNDEKITTKISSDVVESLIGAIGISWQNMYKNGDLAMRNFIFQVWNSLFQIDVKRYQLLYEDPKTRFKQLVESLQLNRSLISTTTDYPQESGGEIVVNVMYDKYPVGTGRISTQGLYKDTAIHEAEKAAYIDALEKDSLQLLLESQLI